MRIAIMGAGGIGSFYAARLSQAGAEVVLIARGAHLAAICQGRLRVEGLGSTAGAATAAGHHPRRAETAHRRHTGALTDRVYHVRTHPGTPGDVRLEDAGVSGH